MSPGEEVHENFSLSKPNHLRRNRNVIYRRMAMTSRLFLKGSKNSLHVGRGSGTRPLCPEKQTTQNYSNKENGFKRLENVCDSLSVLF